jgi:N utilization substance protein A
MATSEFKLAIAQVATERGISPEDVISSIKSAMVKAYVKDFGGDPEQILVNIDEETGETKIIDLEGKDITPSGFGRIAANAARSVITQKIRESEKQMILAEFQDKIGEIVTGVIFRIEHGFIIIDLGKTQAIMPYSEQVQSENYRLNQRIKVLVKEVRQGVKGTEVIVSRSSADFVVKLFEAEVPEIANGTVEIIAIAREAGSRTKMAVTSSDDKIDPVGSCVGQKGVRVQSIISELLGEKIDIIPFATSTEKYIAAALSPARVTEVEIDEAENKAIVSVPEDQLSLAIGKDGQNVRLANKLTKWKIDIKGTKGIFDSETGMQKAMAATEVKESRPAMGIWDELIAKTKAEAEEKAREDKAALERMNQEAAAAETSSEETEAKTEETIESKE